MTDAPRNNTPALIRGRATVEEIAATLNISGRAVQIRAAKGGWEYEEDILPTGARRRLYPFTALPTEVRGAIEKARGRAILKSSPAPAQGERPPLPDAGSLKSYQQDALTARAALLAEIDRLMLEGLSQGRAIETLLQLAQAEALPPDLQRLVPLANARRGKARNLSRTTVYRWLKERNKAGSVMALAPAAPVDTGIPDWAAPLMDLYARPSKPSLAWAVEELAERRPAGQAPSYDQARRFLGRLGAVSRNAGRMGPRALKALKAYVARDVSDLWPTAVYVADGHCFDAEVAHPRHGRPFRPEVTTIIDVHTRRIVGWSVGLAENQWDVTAAAVNAFTHSGVCDIWYADNGPGFNNRRWDDQMTGLCARLSVTKKNALPYNSQARGVIERAHQTVLVRSAKQLPTYMGAAMDGEARQKSFKVTRRDIKATGSSRLLPDWPDFVAFVAEAIRHYNAHPHSSLPKLRDPESGRKRHASPDEVWDSFVSEGWAPDVVGEAEAVDLFRPYERRQARRAMVDLFGNRYFAPELEEFHGEDVLVGYDITDASRVWVRALDGRFIAVARFEGNKKSFFPVSVAEQAREKRVKGRLKRIDEHRAEAIAELSPDALLDHQPESPFAPEDLLQAGREIEAIAEPAPAPALQYAADGRPLFGTDMEWVRWLLEHPDRVSAEDRNGLRDALRSPSFRLELEMNGVAATTLSVLIENDPVENRVKVA